MDSPVQHLSELDSPLSKETIAQIEQVASDLPDLLHSQTLNSRLAALPASDYACLANHDIRLVERLFAIYGYLTSAIMHGSGNKALPKNIAQPFVQLAQMVGRPPMLSYAAQVLSNWKRIDKATGFKPENIRLLLHFTHLSDEAWFFRVHIAIEARAGDIIGALRDAARIAAENGDAQQMLQTLRRMRAGLVDITRIFHRMPDGCDPDIYFRQVRPYLMGFNNVIFEGVANNAPKSLRGGSGAQSSIVPALLAGLGVAHEQNQLTAHLHTMQDYMPVPHQQFIQQMSAATIRDYCAARPPLRDAYNHVLRQLMTFRRAHLYFAKTYIFEKSPSAIGTGGTNFMDFLSKLIDETQQQLL